MNLKFMASEYLTKSDYKRWQFCPTSAFHGWGNQRSKNEDNSFLKYLATEGEVIGLLARRLFSRGRLIGATNLTQAERETRVALQQENATLFEGCISSGDFVVRPDVLVKQGDQLYLTEAKSKLGNLRWHKEGKMLINMYGDVRAGYRDIVHDIAFQSVVLERAFPDLEVTPYFLLPEETTNAQEEEVILARTGFEFCEEVVDQDEVKRRRRGSILRFFEAKDAINTIHKSTVASMDAMVAAWRSGRCPEPTLKYRCKNCEFRLGKGAEKEDGFHVCWGPLAEPDPHLFSLYQLYSVKQPEDKNALLADRKIEAGRTSLFDVEESELCCEHRKRQQMQLNCLRSGQEWIDPELGERINQLSWPVAFVDFETILMSIPWYAGCKSGQVLPFQFSAHVLHSTGEVEHREWLNLKDEIPTVEFIRQLRSALEDIPSILVYTDYEVRVLKEALEFLGRYGSDARDERSWIFDLLHSGRIIDQHQWVHDYYQHPEMEGGRTSIKVVVPAIWRNNLRLHLHPEFKRYCKVEGGEIVDPYKTLPEAVIGGQVFPVREGTAAMRAYREMILGKGAECPATKEILASLLREYVTLDTISQFVIFEH